MREDNDKFNLEQDLEDLKADIDRVGADVTHLIRKATIGRVKYKISKHPLSWLMWAFGAGLTCCTLMKLRRSKK